MPASKLLFGWCSTNHHSDCKTKFMFDGKQIVCQCECHTNDESDEFESERKFNEE